MLYELAVVGAGNMAEAIVRGVIRCGTCTAASVIAADVSPDRRRFFESELKIRAVERAADAVCDAKIVLLSVKPQQMNAALEDMATALDPDALIVSIAAGVSTKKIEAKLSTGPRVVRAMPNTPMLVGEGVVALSAGSRATREDMATARKLFESGAVVIDLDEDKLDAVTAVSASGPAYFFYLVEHMIRAGEANGLSHEQATLLATRTAIGAGAMLAKTADSAQELRRKVTSPGGTTAAAIESFDRAGFDRIIVDAITRATERGRELGKSD